MRPGDNERFDVGKHIKLLNRPGNGIRHNPSGQVCNIHAMAGVALAVKNVGRESAKQRHTIYRYADSAAPGIVNADICQLWIDSRQFRSVLFLDEFRVVAQNN